MALRGGRKGGLKRRQDLAQSTGPGVLTEATQKWPHQSQLCLQWPSDCTPHLSQWSLPAHLAPRHNPTLGPPPYLLNLEGILLLSLHGMDQLVESRSTLITPSPLPILFGNTSDRLRWAY